MHGLGGKPQETWTGKGKKKDVFWPAQLLPEFVEDEKVRILVYGYDADVAVIGGVGVTKDRIHQHGENLLADLTADRQLQKASERPIVFVGHSLGGIVIKRALTISNETMGEHTEHLRSIFVSTYGIIFLGTPHLGADVALWGMDPSRHNHVCKQLTRPQDPISSLS